MTTKILLSLLAVIIFYGCGKSKNESTDASSPGNTGTQNQSAPETKKDGNNFSSTGQQTQTDEKNNVKNSGEGIRVKFPAGSTQVTLNGNINGFGQQITYLFEASKGQKLTAWVKPKTADGNIRIAQIISPSGNADGPFGDQIIYLLKQTGDWKLVLDENQMAGDPWKGEYFLTIDIK